MTCGQVSTAFVAQRQLQPIPQKKMERKKSLYPKPAQRLGCGHVSVGTVFEPAVRFRCIITTRSRQALALRGSCVIPVQDGCIGLMPRCRALVLVCETRRLLAVPTRKNKAPGRLYHHNRDTKHPGSTRGLARIQFFCGQELPSMVVKISPRTQ